jgi:hypothetical protein
MLRSLRRLGVRVAARAVNGRRRYPAYSQFWLNHECWRLVERDDFAARRPAYTWGVLHGAALARALGIPRVTVVEFGVATGRGLVSLDRIAGAVESLLGVGIDVVGFDTGVGLPPPSDVRDVPNLYSPGEFAMDEAALRAELSPRARLELGPIAETLPDFLARCKHPIAFASIDVDYYSSTVDALRAFAGDESTLVPRPILYFDDIIGATFADFNGERLAMHEFNRDHPCRQISPVHGLRWILPWPLSLEKWPEMMYMLHVLDHSRYGERDHLAGGGQAPPVQRA